MDYAQMIFSPTGGTRKVADLLTQDWQDLRRVDLSKADADFSAVSFAVGDAVVIAVPSYGGRVPALAAQRVKQVHGNGARAVLVCVYGNRAYEDTLAELQDAAVEAGFTVVAAVAAVAEHSIAHNIAAGRPDAADAAVLKDFAAQIQKKLDEGNTAVPAIPGDRPYKKEGSGLLPKTGRGCTSCGLCAAQCPAGAIDPADPTKIDKNRCANCMRCVSICPQHAKKVSAMMVNVVSMALKKSCAGRKTPELFL